MCSIDVYATILNKITNDIFVNESEFCDESECFFPEKTITNEDIIIDKEIIWERDKSLVLYTKGSIFFKKEGKIISENNGSVILKSGMEPGRKELYDGTVKFEGESVGIEMRGYGKVKIYYNPTLGSEKHKYHNPSHHYYSQHVETNDNKNLYTYMLVNNIVDLQHIRAFLSGSYALSQNIDASETKRWFKKKGFIPLKYKDKEDMPFSGNFDGNNYSIVGLFINRPDEEGVGLFGGCSGRSISHNVVEDLTLKDFDITGAYYVGSLAGSLINSDLSHVEVVNSKIKAANIAGGLTGSAYKTHAKSIKISNAKIEIKKGKSKGTIAGGVGQSIFSCFFENKVAMEDAIKSYEQFMGYHDSGTQLCLTCRDSKTVCLEFVDWDIDTLMAATNSTTMSIPVGEHAHDILRYVRHCSEKELGGGLKSMVYTH